MSKLSRVLRSGRCFIALMALAISASAFAAPLAVQSKLGTISVGIDAEDGFTPNIAKASADGKWVVVESHEGQIRVYNSKTGQVVKQIDSGYNAIFSPMSSHVVMQQAKSGILTIDLATGEQKKVLVIDSKTGDDFEDFSELKFSSDGRFFLAKTFQGNAFIIETSKLFSPKNFRGHLGVQGLRKERVDFIDVTDAGALLLIQEEGNGQQKFSFGGSTTAREFISNKMIGNIIASSAGGDLIATASQMNGSSLINIYDNGGSLKRQIDLKTSRKFMSATSDKNFISIESLQVSEDGTKIIAQVTHQNKATYWASQPSRFVELDSQTGEVLRVSRSSAERAVLLSPALKAKLSGKSCRDLIAKF